MKKCPYCAEEIQDEAIRCRWCGSDLSVLPSTGTREPTVPEVPPAEAQSAEGPDSALHATALTQTPSQVQTSYRPWYRRAWVLILSLAVLAVGTFGFVYGLRLDKGTEADPDSQRAPGEAVSSQRTETVEPLPKGAWVGEYHTRQLHRIDTATNQVVASTSLGGRPQDIALGHGDVWVTFGEGPSEVWRIDPETDQVLAVIPLGFGDDLGEVSEGEVEAGQRFIWVMAPWDSSTRLVRIDPSTNRVVASDEITDDYVDGWAVGDGSVWIALDGSSNQATKILRIEEATGREVAEIQTELDGVGTMAVGEGAVWISGYETETNLNGVWRIDPATNGVAESIDLGGYGTVAVGEGAVWVVVGEEAIARIDPHSGEVVATVDVGYADEIATGAGSVWVTPCGGDYYLCRIDSRTNQVAPLLPPVTGETRGLAVGE